MSVKPIDVVAEHRRAGWRNLLPLSQGDEAILENRHRQAEIVGDCPAALRADAGQKLENQLFNERFAEPSILERDGSCG